MPIIAKDSGKSEFDPAPEGVHTAVCVDVIDLGVQQGFGGKLQPKIRVVWQIDELNPKTRERYQVRRSYTLSLNEKSALSKDLEAWRGKAFTKEERAEGFDLEKLIGANCQLQIAHRTAETSGNTYANVQAIMAPAKGAPKIEPLNYKRSEKEAGEDSHAGF